MGASAGGRGRRGRRRRLDASAEPGGLPACQAALNTCTADLATSNARLKLAQFSLEKCNRGLTLAREKLAACTAALDQAHQFLATGQTKCWNAAGGEIDCAETGQDGEIQAGAALSYIDNGDTVTDENTGLMWEKKTEANVNALLTWEDAFAVHIAGLNTEPCFAGHCDWRLPNVKELHSIMDYGRVNPAIDPIFGPTASNCWSSTSNANLPPNAWTVGLSLGFVFNNNKSDKFYVRAVRGGLGL